MDPLTELHLYLDTWTVGNRNLWMSYFRDNPDYQIRTNQGIIPPHTHLEHASYIFARDPGNEEYFKEYSELIVKIKNENPDLNIRQAAQEAIFELHHTWHALVVRCWATAGTLGNEYAPYQRLWLNDNFIDSVRFFRMHPAQA